MTIYKQNKMDYRLLKTQRNEIVELIKKYDFDLEGFVWSETSKEVFRIGKVILSRLKYKGTEFYFSFNHDYEDEEIHSHFSPGGQSREQWRSGYGWQARLNHVEEWLMCLKREIEAPDLWEIIKTNEIFSVAAFDERNNTQFSDDEKKNVFIELNVIKTKLDDLAKGNVGHLTLIEDRIKYLENSIDRLTRTDWFHVFRSIVLEIAKAMLLNKETAEAVFAFSYQNISKIVSLLPNIKV